MLDKNALEGVVDTHIHTGPEPNRKRKFNDDELAKDALAVKARAIVIKSHVFETAFRTYLMNYRYPELKTFGGIALNEWMGVQCESSRSHVPDRRQIRLAAHGFFPV